MSENRLWHGSDFASNHVQHEVYGQHELEAAEAAISVSVTEHPDRSQRLVGHLATRRLLQASFGTHGIDESLDAVHLEMNVVASVDAAGARTRED